MSLNIFYLFLRKSVKEGHKNGEMKIQRMAKFALILFCFVVECKPVWAGYLNAFAKGNKHIVASVLLKYIGHCIVDAGFIHQASEITCPCDDISEMIIHILSRKKSYSLRAQQFM